MLCPVEGRSGVGITPMAARGRVMEHAGFRARSAHPGQRGNMLMRFSLVGAIARLPLMGVLPLTGVVLCMCLAQAAGAQVVFEANTAAPQNGVNAFPFGQTVAKWQGLLTPAQLGNNFGQITEFGVGFAGACNVSWPSVRIEMGETTLTATQLQSSASFSANYNVAAKPKQTCYSGAWAMNNAGPPAIQRVTMTAPFNYSGANSLLVTIYVTGAATGTGSSYLLSRTDAASSRIYAIGQGDTDVPASSGGSWALVAGFKFNQQVQGDSAQVRDAGVVTGSTALGLPGVGSNVVRALIRNGGTTVLNGPLTLQYSTDGGTTFPSSQSQTFTLSSFQPLAEQTFDLSTAAPWVLTSPGSYSLVVRCNPAIGTTNVLKAVTFRPDLDVVTCDAAGGNPQPGNNPVSVTVQNNGNFSLAGVTLPLRYTVSGGATYFTQSPAFAGGAALVSTGGQQTFTFTTPWALTLGGSYELTASVFPAITADPDGYDFATQSYPEAGAPGSVLSYVANTTNTVGMQYPFSPSYQCAKVQNTYLPADLGGRACYITHIGWPFSAATAGNWPRVRIELGETTATLAPNTLFDSNYNVSSAPKSVVFDGPLTVTTTASGQVWRVALDRPYYYSAANRLLATVYSDNNSSVVGGMRVYGSGQSGRDVLSTLASGDAPVGTALLSNYGFNTSFRLVQAPANGTTPSLFPVSVSVSSGAAVVGNNTVSVTVRNMSTAWMTTPFTMEYSSDGGATYPVSQTFTPTSLSAQGIETFTFSTTLNLMTMAQRIIAVRIIPPVGSLPQVAFTRVAANPDMVSISTGANDPQTGNNTVYATVKNNGSFSLNNSVMSLRYSVNGGGMWVTQPFVPTTLGTLGSTQTFSFYVPWNFAGTGSASITGEIVPSGSADPDPRDTVTTAYPETGLGGSVVTFFPQNGATTYTQAYPFSSLYTNAKYQQAYPVSVFGGQTAIITHIGFPFSAATTAAYPSVRIELGETSLGALGGAFDGNYNVAAFPRTVVYNGPLSVVTGSAGQLWRVPLTTPYQVSGLNRLLVTVYVNGAAGVTGGSVYYANGWANGSEGCDRVYSLNGGDSASGTVTAGHLLAASFRVVTQQPGNSLWLQGVSMAGGMAAVGSNVIRVAVRNGGTTDLSNTPFTLQYSTDAGLTYPPGQSQTFTLPSFPQQTNVTVDMTAVPWTVFALGSYTVVVRGHPALGTVNTSRTAYFRPDADVLSVNTGAQDPQFGPNTVQVTVKNNGDFSLAGVQIPLRYTVNAGASYVSETFTGGQALAVTDGTQTFSFTAPLNVAGAPVTLTGSLFPVLTGDPDASDAQTSVYPFAGVPGSTVGLFTGSGSNGIPFSSGYNVCKYQTAYYAADLGGQPCLVSHIGFPFASAATASWSNIKIEVGETTAATLGTTFDANYNVAAAPRITVFDGPMSVTTTTAGQVWLQAFNSPWSYGGVNKLLVTLTVTGSTAAAVNIQFSTAPGYDRVYATTTGATATFGTLTTSYATNAAFRVIEQVVAPITVTTASLPVGEATVAYSASLAATGGSGTYTWSVVSSVPALPASLMLAAATGVISGTPGYGDHGRYTVTVRCTDTQSRVQDAVFTLVVLQRNAAAVQLSELVVGANDSIEISHRGGTAVDLSGWNIKVWVDGNTPAALSWSAFPAGTLAFRGNAIQINDGGTAGGSVPTFNTGTAFNASSTSNVAVVLYDAHNNVIDVVATGNVAVASLNNAAAANAGITSSHWATNLTTGSDNYSRSVATDTNTAADWTASAAGTPGVFNPALPVPALEFALDSYPAARVGVAYARTIAAVGGVPPYTYQLVNATSTPWLSINTATGDLSGTPAAGDVGSFPVTAKVTDSTTATAQSTKNLIVLAAAESAAHSFTLSAPSVSSQANAVADIGVALGGIAAAVGDFDIRFTMANPELVFTGVSAGPAAIAAGVSVVAWQRGSSYTLIGFGTGATLSAMAPGSVATLHFKVLPSGAASQATAGTTVVSVIETVARDTQGTALAAAGSGGTITLSPFKDQDVNHSGSVNVQDVQLCVNLILHIATPTYAGQGNVNGSGGVTVADVQSIVNCILNSAACTP
jgi:hypothetical protein